MIEINLFKFRFLCHKYNVRTCYNRNLLDLPVIGAKNVIKKLITSQVPILYKVRVPKKYYQIFFKEISLSLSAKYNENILNYLFILFQELRKLPKCQSKKT